MMKFSYYICVILLTTVVNQISSEMEVDKVAENLLKSLYDVAVIVPNKIVNEIEQKNNYKIQEYLKDAIANIKGTINKIESEYNHSPIFTPEQKANQKKIIGYSSYYVTGLFQESIKFVKTMTNKSFDALPDNIQTKLLDMARDVNVFLNKVKETNKEDSLKQT